LKFAVVALIALTAVASFLYKSRKGALAKESGAAAKFTATSGQPKPETAGERDVAQDPVVGVQRPVVAKLETAQAVDTARENDAAAKLLAPSEQIKIENASERHIVSPRIGGVQHNVTAKVGNVQTANAGKENDPAELWKAIRRGSVSAEVALANLYLTGGTVPRNCEQAHMLLRAASSKGSKAADNLLKSSYAERCE
jgi:TPR repeat protein